MKKIIILFTIVISVVINGCATILTGSTDIISFDSDPEGAKILMDGIEIRKTPASITLKRPGFSDKEVILKLEGYEDRRFVLQKEFNVIAILNFAGWVGWIVDIGTGSFYKYSPKAYDMDLEPKAYNIDELQKDTLGRLIVPDDEGSLFVYDEEVGYKILFE